MSGCCFFFELRAFVVDSESHRCACTPIDFSPLLKHPITSWLAVLIMDVECSLCHEDCPKKDKIMWKIENRSSYLGPENKG